VSLSLLNLVEQGLAPTTLLNGEQPSGSKAWPTATCRRAAETRISFWVC